MGNKKPSPPTEREVSDLFQRQFDRIPRFREVSENLKRFAARCRETSIILFSVIPPGADVPVGYWDEAADVLAKHLESKAAELDSHIERLEQIRSEESGDKEHG